MTRQFDLALTALAPAIWGSTYYVTTEYLSGHSAITIAMLRALPAGLILLLIVRQLPGIQWLGKIAVLGALNFSVFWVLLFVAAYRLPGGVAATVGAVQPLIVIFLARGILGAPIRTLSVFAAIAGMGGVALLLLNPSAALDPIGIAAGLGGAASMATGVVLTRKWQPPVPLLTFTAWQLTAGGVLLIPLAIWAEPAVPQFSMQNIMALVYLGGIGGAITYFLWFRGISRLETPVVSVLGFLSPLTAVTLGWLLLGQSLTPMQLGGAVIVIFSVRLSQSQIRLVWPFHKTKPVV
jgi:probable blue pigment (indigoidine) exporter